jgi:hypothetical protein
MLQVVLHVDVNVCCADFITTPLLASHCGLTLAAALYAPGCRYLLTVCIFSVNAVSSHNNLVSSVITYHY